MKTSRLLSVCVAASSLFMPYKAYAQTESVNPYISKSIPSVALNNILNSETVFCYTVKKAPEGYNGYTLDQMAITGYCGRLGVEKSLIINEFFKKKENISQSVANCQVEPKIIFRFIRGVDSTDILFSDTCPSMTIFYGGTVKSFNAEPVQQSVQAVVEFFSKGKINFTSPALLNQLMPVGVAVNNQNKSSTEQPTQFWVQPPQQPSAKPAAQGWNRIKKN